jgi:phosphosulfolactate synthase (CoM biosynthesis protein A)
VLVEAAELVEKGKLRRKTIDLLVKSLDMSRVMIELPGHGSATCELRHRGHEKGAGAGARARRNLANVPAASIVDTEATRTGLGTAGPLKNA